MPDAQHDIGLATRLSAEAVGHPGQRRFRILVEGAGGAASVWLEKEQLHSLAVSIGRLLEIIRNDFPQAQARAASLRDTRGVGYASLEFQSGSWSIGYDESAHVLEFTAHDVEEDQAGPAKARFLASLDQGRSLSEEALRVYAAGRPRCPLCEAPLNEGEAHVCPRSNGHGRH